MRELSKGTTRREILKAAGLGALGAAATGGFAARALQGQPALAATTTLALVATDGYITMPGREDDPGSEDRDAASPIMGQRGCSWELRVMSFEMQSA